MSNDQQSRPELAEGTRRVLLFAKLFPPCNCWPTASERAVGLARGLSSLGWTPVVITRQLPAEGCTCGAGTEEDVEPRRGEGLEVIRVPARKWPSGRLPKAVRRLVLFVRAAPDDWTSEARTAARKYTEDSDVDLVWTTSAPIVSTRLGRFFQRKLDVPWVAELRDSVWRSSVMVVRGRGTRVRLLRMRAMQLARPLRVADAVVHVAPKEAQADVELTRQASRVVPSGFDEDTWAEIHAAAGSKGGEGRTLTVLLAGHVYTERPGYSTFFEGARLYARSPQGKVRPLRVAYLGPSFDALLAEAQRYGMAARARRRWSCTSGTIASGDARRRCSSVDSVRRRDTRPREGSSTSISAACRPILAVPGTDVFVADILRRTGHGVCARDAEAVRAALERLASGSSVGAVVAFGRPG